MQPSKRQSFEALFQEFLPEYAEAPAGKTHREQYARVRKEARTGYDAVVRAVEKGEDATELVLRRLLPHADTQANRDLDRWISLAPPLAIDIRSWFEITRGLKPASSEWASIAKTFFSFVRACNEDPASLGAACMKSSSVPRMKGLHAAIASPILNALRPKDFTLVSNKSRPAINFFAGTAFSRDLDD